MKNLLILILLFPMFCYSQSLRIKEINVDSFPKIKIKLNYVNPAKLPSNSLELKEDGKKVNFTYSNIKITDPLEDRRNILFLFEDMKNRGGETEMFKTVLKNALPNVVKQNDKVNIYVFDRERSRGKVLRKLSKDCNYTNNADDLINQLKLMTNNDTCKRCGSDLYTAIFEGLTDLKDTFPNKNNFLVVLSGGKDSRLQKNKVELAKKIALDNHIPVYLIEYKIYNDDDMSAFIADTYGKSVKTKDAGIAKDSLELFMKNAMLRRQGNDYELVFNSDYSKDGKEHILELTAENGKAKIDVKITSPTPNIIAIIKQYFVFILIGLVVLAALIISLVYVKNKKQKQLELIKEREEALKEEQQQRELAAQAQKIENQQHNIDSIQRIKQQEEERIRQIADQERKAKELEAQKHEMRRFGNFPRLDYKTASGVGKFNITEPEIFIGRSKSNSISFENDVKMSKQHCKIFFNNGNYIIQDLDSSNGIFVNNMRIPMKELRSGDTIRIGNTILMFYK